MSAAWAASTAALDIADPAGRVRVEPLVPQLLPVGPGLDGELDEMGHRGVVVEHFCERPVLVWTMRCSPRRSRVFSSNSGWRFADGHLGDDGNALEPEVPFDVLVGPALARQALVVPDGDRLVPVAELHVGDAVRVLPTEDPVESFSGGQRTFTYSANDRGSGRG